MQPVAMEGKELTTMSDDDFHCRKSPVAFVIVLFNFICIESPYRDPWAVRKTGSSLGVLQIYWTVIIVFIMFI